jgi:hypothetical protein
LTNRCDYRRPVASGKDLETCRDANEDHGMSYEGTCAAYADVAFDDPALRHGGASCWSVSKFADPEAAGIEEERTTKDDSRAATSAAPRLRPRAFGGPATFFLTHALWNLSRLWWQPLL